MMEGIIVVVKYFGNVAAQNRASETCEGEFVEVGPHSKGHFNEKCILGCLCGIHKSSDPAKR